MWLRLKCSAPYGANLPFLISDIRALCWWTQKNVSSSFQSCSVPYLKNNTAFGTCCRLRLLLGKKLFTVASSVNLQNDRVYASSNAKKRYTSLLNACCVVGQHNWKDTICGIHVSPGSAETLVRRGGIANHHLIAYSFSSISAKNYQNRLMCVEVIMCNISVVFLRHSIYWMFWIISRPVNGHLAQLTTITARSSAAAGVFKYHQTTWLLRRYNDWVSPKLKNTSRVQNARSSLLLPSVLLFRLSAKRPLWRRWSNWYNYRLLANWPDKTWLLMRERHRVRCLGMWRVKRRRQSWEKCWQAMLRRLAGFELTRFGENSVHYIAIVCNLSCSVRRPGWWYTRHEGRHTS